MCECRRCSRACPVDARASTMTTNDDNDDDGANNDDFLDILEEILGATFMPSSVLDLDLAYGAADSNVDSDRPLFHSPPSPLPSPFFLLLLLLGSPPEIQKVSLSLSSFPPFWWLSCNKLSSLSLSARQGWRLRRTPPRACRGSDGAALLGWIGLSHRSCGTTLHLLRGARAARLGPKHSWTLIAGRGEHAVPLMWVGLRSCACVGQAYQRAGRCTAPKCRLARSRGASSSRVRTGADLPR